MEEELPSRNVIIDGDDINGLLTWRGRQDRLTMKASEVFLPIENIDRMTKAMLFVNLLVEVKFIGGSLCLYNDLICSCR